MTAQAIIKLRQKTGLSMDKFGALIGVTRQAVCQWEKEKTNPSGMAVRLLKQLENKI